MTATNTQVRGLKYKIHQEFFDFIPGFEKQAASSRRLYYPIMRDNSTRKAKAKKEMLVRKSLLHGLI
jgi:hypothetical protein